MFNVCAYNVVSKFSVGMNRGGGGKPITNALDNCIALTVYLI